MFAIAFVAAAGSVIINDLFFFCRGLLSLAVLMVGRSEKNSKKKKIKIIIYEFNKFLINISIDFVNSV